MGYDLQMPIGLKDGAGDFEPILCRKNPNVKGSREEETKRYGIGFPLEKMMNPS